MSNGVREKNVLVPGKRLVLPSLIPESLPLRDDLVTDGHHILVASGNRICGALVDVVKTQERFSIFLGNHASFDQWMPL